MASKSKRHKLRNARRRRADRARPTQEASDPYAELVLESMAGMSELLHDLQPEADGFADRVDAAFAERVRALAELVQGFDPSRLTEVGRLAYLPIGPADELPIRPEGGLAQLELLILAAVAGQGDRSTAPESAAEPQPQAMSEAVSNARPLIDAILHLGQLRTLVSLNPDDPLALISFSVQGSEMTMRNSSYPDVAQATVRSLLDGSSAVHAALEHQLGFDASDALSVLTACHELQMEKMNTRGVRLASSSSAFLVGEGLDPSNESMQDAMAAFFALFEPASTEVTVTADELSETTDIARERVERVLQRFTLDMSGATPLEAIDRFVRGDNPWRLTPLLRTPDGRVMHLHDAHVATAVKESLEDHLKSTPMWDAYAKHRGDLLENRVREAVERAFPGGVLRNGFQFFIPANEAEALKADPLAYTKRVECDHLLLVDDVAVIIEDKAIAFSPLSRSGKLARQRTDLTGIIRKAADQAGRVREAIERDGGLRIEGEGWLDLAHIRETHTIAVSLDDISTVLTATADLVEAGLIGINNIPWTVSLHDLELIVDLVDRPAELLLYVRRRRDPATTVMYTAPDELDLFLYFLESGLWVEPDPELVRKAFPFMPPPSPGELRRFTQQARGFITSRTDRLDRWHYTRDTDDPSPKPAMPASSAGALADELQRRGVFAWLSIGATLLSGSTAAQEQFARNGTDLLDQPDPLGRGRSMTVPIAASVDPRDGWLFVWATKPHSQPLDKWIASLRRYLQAKKHQLALPRAAAFLYDESTRDLLDVAYEGQLGTLAPDLAASVARLRPASDLRSRLPPAAKTKRSRRHQ